MPSLLPIIGIPCASYDVRPVPYPLIHGNNDTYIHAVEQTGGVPFLIPLLRNEHALRAAFEQLDGLLLAGGVDVDPARYGEAPHPNLGSVNAEQDRVEFLLTEWARAAQMPIFAICRGLQVLNVAYGGTLYQDLPSQYDTKHNHSESVIRKQRDHQSHRLDITPTSKLGQYMGVESLPINTLHHQAIKDLAPGLRAVGWAEDGIIEAIESPNEPWVIGVQCHPEELVKGVDGRWGGVFAGFVHAASAWHEQRVVQEL